MTDADRSVIGGRYQVIASLGKGGMGLVYKAYDPVLDRTVALKKMIATVVDSEEGRQRFYIEARAAARLNHPNIVTIHELEEYSGDIYIVMELLDGVSLAAFMRQRVHMPLAAHLTIIAQIADGLHYAHKRAIVHRDVKPPNLVLTTTGNVKILDFGIARLASNEITKKGKLLGTPHYMAPEQVLEQPVDARADLFSLGAVAYELVTGIKPFAADSIPALLMQITSTAHRPVLEVAPETEPALAAIIDRLLAKDRTDRFLTGMELVAALDLIGEIDRVDIVAEAVSAVMGPSGDMTVYAPISSTPLPTVTPTPTPQSVTPLSVTPPVVMPPPSVTPPSAAEDITQSLSAPTPTPTPTPATVDPPAVSQLFGSSRPDLPAKVSAVELPDTLAAVPPVPPVVPPPLPSAPVPAASAPTAPVSASPAPTATAPTAPAPATPASAAPAPAATAPAATVPARADAPPAPSIPLPVAAVPSKATGASAPRGFVNQGVPQPRHRSGSGAAIVVVGLLLLPAVVAAGWWAVNSVRAALQKGTTASDTTSPSTVKDADPAISKPAESAVATTDQAKPADTPGETPDPASQEPAQTPPAVDANAATTTEAVKPPEGAEPAKPSDATPVADASQTAQTSPAAQTAQTNQTPGANQPNANQANANQGDATRPPVEARDARNVTPPVRDVTRDAPPPREPSRDPAVDRTRETAPDTVVRDATSESSRAPGRDARENPRSLARDTPRDTTPPRTTQTPPDNARVTPTPREPAPPVREDAPPAEPAREPSTPADTRALDYGSLSAFRGGSRSTGSASSVYTDSPSTAAAVARITYTLDAYGDAIAERDLAALRDVRSPVTPAEAALLKEGRTTVRFSNLDVSLSGNDARVRCRRALVTNGKTVSSGPAEVRLTRKPEGWVITDIR
jgi:serine/threonine protein kinase